jgi:hypothetical protein
MKSELAYDQILEFFNNTEEWENDHIENKTLKAEDLTRIVNLVTDKLNSADGRVRYIASHLILTFKFNSAKDKLIQRILDSRTKNENGTMTYALGHLNCENNLVDVFKILATQSYESKCHAYNILCEQEFEFTKNDLLEMKAILKQVELYKEENQIYDMETLEMIKDTFEGFEKFLTKNG